MIKGFFKKLWSVDNTTETSNDISELPSVDDVTFYKKSKIYLQRFDEYITASEAEVETLSIELDGCLEQVAHLEIQLKQLNKPNSWHERHLLLKLDRLQLHCGNLKRRIEIYSQNIRVYLALISQIQDMKAMRMYGGVDESKMETIWLDFKETLEKYKNILMAESSANDSEKVTVQSMEDRLTKLKKTVMPEVQPPTIDTTAPQEVIKLRPPLEQLDPTVTNRSAIEKRLITE